MLSDKDVGDLWAYAHDPKHGYHKIICDLIHKLIEERMKNLEVDEWDDKQFGLECVLDEFGIDPKTWK